MIQISRPYYNSEEIEAINKEISKCLENGILVNGPNLKIFENLFSSYHGVEYAIGVNSGSSALELCIKALEIEGSEIITTNNTCVSVPNSIANAGCLPVLADIKKETLALDPVALKKQITKKTKALVLVHMEGTIQEDVDQVIEICKKYNLFVIEDACRALGSKKGNKLAGTFGDLSFFSFYATKTISTGNGGMILTPNSLYSDKLKILRSHGRVKVHNHYSYDVFGNNMIMGEIEAILGINQLKNLDNKIVHRNNIAKKYDKALANLSNIAFAIDYSIDIVNSYYRYPIIISLDKDSSQFESLFTSSKINLGHYYPMISQTKLYSSQSGSNRGNLEVSERISRHIFSLPIHNDLSSDDVKRIINKMQDIDKII